MIIGRAADGEPADWLMIERQQLPPVPSLFRREAKRRQN
jgi:hypothetical protein